MFLDYQLSEGLIGLIKQVYRYKIPRLPDSFHFRALSSHPPVAPCPTSSSPPLLSSPPSLAHRPRATPSPPNSPPTRDPAPSHHPPATSSLFPPRATSLSVSPSGVGSSLSAIFCSRSLCGDFRPGSHPLRKLPTSYSSHAVDVKGAIATTAAHGGSRVIGSGCCFRIRCGKLKRSEYILLSAMDREPLVPVSLSPSSSSLLPLRLDPPPESSWVDEYRRSFAWWKSLRDFTQLPIQLAVSRVNQFDAARLDVEMSAMLKEQLVKVFSLMKPGFLFQYEPELDAFLEFLIWRFSIWVDRPTPGNVLMNLRYRDERAVPAGGKEVRTGLEGPGLSVSQKLWYCLSTVGGQYIWARVQSFSAFRRWGDSEQRSLARRAWILLQRIEGLYKVASFSNMLVFLYSGRYRSIVERVLRARLIYGSPNMNRAVSFEYMNRQLVLNEFSEMLLLLLPLLNSSSARRLLPFSKDKSSSSASNETVCPICESDPAIPFVALPCQHRFCYYCLRTRCAAANSYRCGRCNEPVAAIQRYGTSETRASTRDESRESTDQGS